MHTLWLLHDPQNAINHFQQESTVQEVLPSATSSTLPIIWQTLPCHQQWSEGAALKEHWGSGAGGFQAEPCSMGQECSIPAPAAKTTEG